MKKATWIKIAAMLIAIIPPVVVLLLNFPVIVQRADTTISAAALVVMVLICCVFKDAVKRFYARGSVFSGFKILVTLTILSWIAVTLGDQILQISLVALVAGAVALPLNMWYNYEVRPPTKNEMIDALESIVKGDKVDEKESDKKS